MRSLQREWLVLVPLAFAVAAIGVSCTPFPAAVRAADDRPVNLKVLPKDTTAADVRAQMKAISRDLGVECSFCHEQDADTHRIQFAGDGNPLKETARAMMRMTRDINDKYLGALGDRRYATPITCGDCHQGQTQPPPFEEKR